LQVVPGRWAARLRAARRLPWVLLIGLATISAPGCSTVKFVYNQLDWLLPYYLGDYVSLTREQVLRLDDEFARLRRWHCNTQLQAYVRWLQAANDDVQAGNIGYTAIEARYVELQRYLRSFTEEASRGVAEMMLMTSDAQVIEIFHNLDRENRKLRSGVEERSLEERRMRSTRRMEEQLERWVGDLTPAQRDAVAAWSMEMVGGDIERLEARVTWQRELRRLLETRVDTPEFREGVRRLFVEPERFRPAEVTRNQTLRRERTLHLLATIGATLTPEQRASISRRAAKWADDFEELACVGKPAPTARENWLIAMAEAV
jgi:hypothetical protein